MNLLRRFTAVLSSALLLQLSLLASGAACPMHSDHPAASAAHPGGGMAREHGGAAAALQAHTALGVPDASSTPSSHPANGCDMNGSTCGMPWSPGSCVSMTTCAIGTSAPSTTALAFVALSARTVVSYSAAALPIGPTYAPELPPPRA